MELRKILPRLSGRPLLLATGGVIVLCGAVFAVNHGRAWYALSQARDAIGKGFPAVAAEYLHRHRKRLIRFDDGCPVMINAYFQSRRGEMLDWASQACLESGREIPEAYLGLAAARELVGRDQDALQILAQSATRFDTVPDFYYRIAQIFVRNRNAEGATQAYLEAVKRGEKNGQLMLDALQFMVQAKKGAEARQIADKIKETPTNDPEVKLVIARALAMGGDAEGAKAQTEQARTLLASRPSGQKEALEKAYADVFSGGQMPPGQPGSPGPGPGPGPATLAPQAPLAVKPPAVTSPPPPAPARK